MGKGSVELAGEIVEKGVRMKPAKTLRVGWRGKNNVGYFD